MIKFPTSGSMHAGTCDSDTDRASGNMVTRGLTTMHLMKSNPLCCNMLRWQVHRKYISEQCGTPLNSGLRDHTQQNTFATHRPHLAPDRMQRPCNGFIQQFAHRRVRNAHSLSNTYHDTVLNISTNTKHKYGGLIGNHGTANMQDSTMRLQEAGINITRVPTTNTS